ncbi:MAG: hypothetical protein K0Q64_2250 [Nitrobacter vulgaris]|nr:hypothetical protein [Nitrobacter vulgaris]
MKTETIFSNAIGVDIKPHAAEFAKPRVKCVISRSVGVPYQSNFSNIFKISDQANGQRLGFGLSHNRESEIGRIQRE